MTFRALLMLNGKTATGIEVPEEVVLALGAGKRPAVRVSINGYAYRTTVAPMGGRFLVGVSAEHRLAAGLSAGDEVDVELQLDTEPRTVAVPGDLAAALDAAGVRAAFERLAFTHRKEYVRSVEEARKPETRQRRIESTVLRLTGH